MKASEVLGMDVSSHIIVQGFRPGPGLEEPSVVLLVETDHGSVDVEFDTVNANILAEIIRQHAEFAGSPREEGK